MEIFLSTFFLPRVIPCEFFPGSLRATSTCSSIRYTSRSDSFLLFFLPFFYGFAPFVPRYTHTGKKKGSAKSALPLNMNYVLCKKKFKKKERIISSPSRDEVTGTARVRDRGSETMRFARYINRGCSIRASRRSKNIITIVQDNSLRRPRLLLSFASSSTRPLTGSIAKIASN